MKKLRHNFTTFQNNGFSLTDLMITIALLSILSTIAIRGFQKYQIRTKTTEVYNNFANTSKAELSYYVDNITFRATTKNPATLEAGGTHVLEDQSSWRSLGSPIPIGAYSHFGYEVIAGSIDASGTEFLNDPATGNNVPAGAYMFGNHPTNGTGTCPSSNSPSDLGLSMSPSSHWFVLVATADFIDDGGSCTLLFQPFEQFGEGTSTGPVIKVDLGQ